MSDTTKSSPSKVDQLMQKMSPLRALPMQADEFNSLPPMKSEQKAPGSPKARKRSAKKA